MRIPIKNAIVLGEVIFLKKGTILGVMLCLALSIITPIYAKETLKLNAQNVALIDANTSRILYQSNGDVKAYPASMTKVMTMLLGIEHQALDQKVTMSEEAVYSIEYGSSHISLMPDEEVTLRQLLLATSLASANDASNGIAEAVGGSIDGFVKMMNDKAKAIGLKNTHFTNAHGLHNKKHYTTPIDMAKLLAYAMQNEDYRKLTGQLEAIIPETNITEERYLYTHNQIMDSEGEFYIPEVKSGKSGYTPEANYCFVAYASKNDLNLVACVMGVDSREAYNEDLKALFNYGYENFQSYNPNELTKKIKIDSKFFYTRPLGRLDHPFDPVAITEKEQKQLKVQYTYKENTHQLKKGKVAGKASLTLNDEVLQTRNVLIKTPSRSFGSILLSWGLRLLIGLVLIALFMAIGLIVAKKIYTKHMKNKRKKKTTL